MALELITGLCATLVLLNAWTTRRVLRDDLSTQGQRTAQILCVWAVPFLGALLTLHMKRSEPEASTGRYRENPDPGDDYGYSRPRNRKGETTRETEGAGSGEGGSND